MIELKDLIEAQDKARSDAPTPWDWAELNGITYLDVEPMCRMVIDHFKSHTGREPMPISAVAMGFTIGVEIGKKLSLAQDSDDE